MGGTDLEVSVDAAAAVEVIHASGNVRGEREEIVGLGGVPKERGEASAWVGGWEKRK